MPLAEAVEQTRRIPKLIAAGDYATAIQARGDEFASALSFFDELSSPDGSGLNPAPDGRRIGVMHGGGLAPGMNAAAKAVVRLGLARGHTMVGIEDGFPGLMAQTTRELTWRDVDGWDQEGGAALGTRRSVPRVEDLYAIARAVETARLDALLVIGGWTAYQSAALMLAERDRYPSLKLPLVCLPATIDNNLPGTQMCIGADTALNVIVDAIDKIKTSASASRRCFVAETMGRDCGYLALMGALAGGAEQVYLNETPVTLAEIETDLAWLVHSFDRQHRDFCLWVRNEKANANYTTEVLAHLVDEAGRGRYDTRTARIGHIQQGGTPTPADRILATELAERALSTVEAEWAADAAGYACVGVDTERMIVTDLAEAMKATDADHQRPAYQWWLGLRDLIPVVNRQPA
jgi:6-phosphofructokinase 1